MNVSEFVGFIEETVKAQTLKWYNNPENQELIEKYDYKIPEDEDDWQDDELFAENLDEFYYSLKQETQTPAGVLKVLQHEIINGDEQYVVFQIGDEYFKVSGYWNSYAEDISLHYDGRWSKVAPVERLVTFYEDIS